MLFRIKVTHIPIKVGPPPKAMIFNTKKNNAVDIARTFTGARVCAKQKRAQDKTTSKE